jgi:drug/metabolite transporter (DMT)-like permease
MESRKQKIARQRTIIQNPKSIIQNLKPVESEAAKTRSNFINGILISLTGAVLFSTKAIFVKLAYRDTNVDAITLLALRMIFSLPFFVFSAYASSRKTTNVRFTPKQWALIALTGCLGYYVSSLLDFLGLQFVTAGIERLILFIFPTLVLLMSAVIFKEKVKPIQWAAVLITYAGLSIAFFSEVDFTSTGSKDFIFGSVLIFICAFTYAAYIIGSGRLIPQVGPTKFNSYAMTFAAAGVLIHFFITSNQSLFHLPPLAYTYSILMAIFSTVIPSYMITQAIKRIGPDNVAIIGSVGPVSTLIMAYFFLQEQLFLFQLVGTAMILGGVALIGRREKR